MKRSPLKKPTLAQVQAFDRKPRKPIRRSRRRIRAKSARREAETPERQRVVAEAFARDGHRCRARDLVPQVRCRGPLDPHEIIPRSAWAAGYLVLANIVSLCRAHHDWTEEHRGKDGEAHRIGLHGFSWERPR